MKNEIENKIPKLNKKNDQKFKLTQEGANRLEEWKNAFRGLPGFEGEYGPGDRFPNEIFGVRINLSLNQEITHTIWVALMNNMTAEISCTCECNEKNCPAKKEIFEEVSGTWDEIYTLVLNFLHEIYSQVPELPSPISTANV